ncbi:MAG TPA: DinB family protein [Spirochaetia bacterium]|nr:DinB family protein [Spirochaetia bacterium]
MISIKSHFALLARYNKEINSAMYGILSPLSDADRKSKSGSFFTSIHGILNHILASDVAWLSRFRTLSSESVALNDPATSNEGVTWGKEMYEQFDDLATRRAAVDAVIVRWIDELTEELLTETLRYQDFRGNARQYIMWMAMDHFFNHQTHHRGAISQILDEKGVENDYSNIIYIL